MTNQEFITAAEKANKKVYAIKNVSENGNKAISTQENIVFWNKTLNEVAAEWLYN